MNEIPSNKYYCQKCHQTLDEKKFYKSKNVEKYPPDGRLPECKSCLTMHVDNWDPETFKPILKEIDVPWIEDEWNKLMIKYANDPKKMTGTTVLGRYLSKMKLKQWKDYSWSDTEFLAQKAEDLKKASMEKQGYTQEEIQQKLAAINEALPEKPTISADSSNVPLAPTVSVEEKYFDFDLTEEDKKMLILKWGGEYKPYEWIQLEQFYNDMCNSYDIQTPAHKDYLKLICKTSLKAHKLVDFNDIEGFQKLSKVYDNLNKSANFTAAQNKVKGGDFIDSISELVALCEKEGFIPTYYDGTDNDKVDATLTDLQKYTYNLINQETNLSTLIENALQKIQIDSEKEHNNNEENNDEDLDEIEEEINEIDGSLNETLEDSDFEDHYNFIENEREKDIKTYQDLENGDGK